MENFFSSLGQFFLFLITTVGGTTAVFAFFGKAAVGGYIESMKAEFAIEREKYKNELALEMETHRVKLKKSEFFFEKEFEATSELVAIRRKMMPEINWPDMDWAEACEQIALGFPELEKTLKGFIANYGAVLPDEVVDKISLCIALSGHGKFGVEGPEVDSEARKAADKIYDHISEAEKFFLEQIRSQI